MQRASHHVGENEGGKRSGVGEANRPPLSDSTCFRTAFTSIQTGAPERRNLGSGRAATVGNPATHERVCVRGESPFRCRHTLVACALVDRHQPCLAHVQNPPTSEPPAAVRGEKLTSSGAG